MAVDDLLLEVGYPAKTLKGIAERAGVGRQTVYRWWSTKAEIPLEASVEDAEELAVSAEGTLTAVLLDYLRALRTVLLPAVGDPNLVDEFVDRLVGPPLLCILTGRHPDDATLSRIVDDVERLVGERSTR